MPTLVNAYVTLREPPPLTFPHQLLGSRDRRDPALAPHLDGFSGYVMNQSGGQMTANAYHIMRHLQRVQRHFSFNVADADLNAMSAWAWQANAILYLPNGTVCDPSGRQLIPDDPAQSAAEIPHPPDAHDRKARIDHRLAALNIHILPTLPPVISEFEVILRPGPEVTRRCLALCVVALRAESVATNQPIPLSELQTRMGLGVGALSPSERQFVNAIQPSEQEVVDFAWRYEALFLLEWALGLVDELPFPTSICDVPLAARLAIDNNTPGFVQTARLRPAGEILDALDLHYRLNWVIRQAELDKREIPGGIDPGVVNERHYALNWLVQFEGSDWDDVDTPS